MTQQEIDAFLAIVEQGSVTGAAESLFLTQSTLSNRLRVLEEELGTQLFRRGRGQRRIELTEAGERFIPLAEKWRLLWRETASFSTQQRLDFVAISSVNTYIMPQVLRRMGELSHISLCTYHTMEAYTQVESGQAEIGLVPSTRYSRYVEATHIFTEPYSLICDRDSSLTAYQYDRFFMGHTMDYKGVYPIVEGHCVVEFTGEWPEKKFHEAQVEIEGQPVTIWIERLK